MYYYNIYMAGRPSKLNEELIQQVYEEIKQGLPVKYTCDLLMITQKSFSNWMQQGEEDISNENYDSLFAQFFLTIKKAQAEYVKDAKQNIRSGRLGWQGESWWLERTRQDFMPKQEITAGDDGKVTVVLGGKVKDVKYNNDNTKR